MEPTPPPLLQEGDYHNTACKSIFFIFLFFSPFLFPPLCTDENLTCSPSLSLACAALRCPCGHSLLLGGASGAAAGVLGAFLGRQGVLQPSLGLSPEKWGCCLHGGGQTPSPIASLLPLSLLSSPGCRKGKAQNVWLLLLGRGVPCEELPGGRGCSQNAQLRSSPQPAVSAAAARTPLWGEWGCWGGSALLPRAQPLPLVMPGTARLRPWRAALRHGACPERCGAAALPPLPCQRSAAGHEKQEEREGRKEKGGVFFFFSIAGGVGVRSGVV